MPKSYGIYRYFIQLQLDSVNNAVIGYELLMKQYTDEGWRPPQSFAAIPAATIASVLVATTEKVRLKVGSVSVNLNRTQMLNEEINTALIKAQSLLRPVRLNVELTEEETDKDISIAQMLPMISQYDARGMEISLDDVGTGQNQVADVKPLLPYASEMKFALQNFSVGIDDPQLQKKLIFWRDIAAAHKLRFIVEGIEDAHDDAVLDQLDVTFRQGYFYGKPTLLKVKPDDPD
jgi:EAL domain-containing protein (putative c-di-GMP-specific phosphodiesterase class I)